MLILIIEDDPLIMLTARDILEEAGFATISAMNGAEACVIINDRLTELVAVVTDVNLGDGPDGWDVAHFARTMRADLPIVYATGYDPADWAANGVARSTYVSKPYASEHLLDALSSLLMQ